MEVTYSKAGTSDVPACASLYLASRAAAFPLIPKGLHPINEVTEHFATTLFPKSEVTVAVVDSVIVGFSIVAPGELDSLYVRADMTGAGIGSELVRRAKQQVDGPLELWAFESNIPAQRFYERHGFVIAYRTNGNGNEEHAPDIRYIFAPPAR